MVRENANAGIVFGGGDPRCIGRAVDHRSSGASPLGTPSHRTDPPCHTGSACRQDHDRFASTAGTDDRCELISVVSDTTASTTRRSWSSITQPGRWKRMSALPTSTITDMADRLTEYVRYARRDPRSAACVRYRLRSRLIDTQAIIDDVPVNFGGYAPDNFDEHFSGPCGQSKTRSPVP